METKQYLFNKNGVCTNPDVLGEVGLENYIEVGQAPNGKWGYGLSYQFDQAAGGSGGFGVCLKRCIYESRRDAVLNACQYIREIAAKQDSTGRSTYYASNNFDHCKPCTCHDMRKCVEKAYNEVSQQKLFE